jgi:hypothetical protein
MVVRFIMKFNESGTVRKYFRIERKEIAYLKFVFEAHEGIAVITTVDAANGIVVMYIPAGCLADTDKILAGLSREMMLLELSEPEALKYAQTFKYALI